MKDRSKLFSEDKFWEVIDKSKVDSDNQREFWISKRSGRPNPFVENI